MTNILIYGDSNSWGYTDEDAGQKYSNRWPVVFKNFLKQKKITCNLIEDSLPGRTTNIDDMVNGKHLNGASTFKSSLLAHSPIDIVIIMLGTNDLKKRFNRKPEDISNGLLELISIADKTFSGKGTWHDQNKSQIIILTPPALGKLSDEKNWPNYKEWVGGFQKSKELNESFKAILNDKKVKLYNCNDIIKSSEIDPIHWSKNTHHEFGRKFGEFFINSFKL